MVVVADMVAGRRANRHANRIQNTAAGAAGGRWPVAGLGEVEVEEKGRRAMALPLPFCRCCVAVALRSSSSRGSIEHPILVIHTSACHPFACVNTIRFNPFGILSQPALGQSGSGYTHYLLGSLSYCLSSLILSHFFFKRKQPLVAATLDISSFSVVVFSLEDSRLEEQATA